MTHIPKTLILSISLLLTSQVQAQTKNPGSNPQLDSLLTEIRTTMKREHMPGLLLSIVTKDSIIYSGGLGYADLENKVKASGSSLFHMNSVTKMFTAIAIQKLISDGKLNLNDKLKSIAPEIPFENPWEPAHPVRVVHLLEHTAGFDDIHLNQMLSRTGKPLKGIEAVESISTTLVSRWRPGERMTYSNPGYVVLGYLIEKLSGMPWNEYVRGNVLLPLGMTKSVFDLDGKEKPGYAQGYYFIDEGFKRFAFGIPGGNGASGALVSTADDLSLFIRHLLNGWKTVQGGWMTEQTLDEMERVHSTLAAKHGLQTGYGLANELFPNNPKISFRGHSGMGEGFNSWVFYNREAGLGYAICNNGNTGMWRMSQLIEEFLTKELKKPELQDTVQDLSRFIPLTGYYQFMNPRSEMFGFREKIFNGLSLSIVNNKLVVSYENGRVDSLVNTSGNLFRGAGNIIPSYVLGKDSQGKAFFNGDLNGFYQQTPYIWVFIQKALIYAGFTAMILSVIAALIAILLAVFRKTSWKLATVVLLPALAVVSLIAAMQKIRMTDHFDKAAFAEINYTTMYIFLGTLGFALFSLASIYLLFIRWPDITRRWIRAVLVFNHVFIFYMVCLLLYHGLIGVRVWNL